MRKRIVLAANILAISTSFAGDMGGAGHLMQEGLFIGLGGNYNSINTTQNAWGEGISSIQTSTGANTNGIAQGSGATFHAITNTFAPEVQAGYMKYFSGTDNLYGLKFSYQYLRANATNPDLYIPQLGQSTSSTGTTSALFGYVIADSVQISMNHELALLAFIGHAFENKYIYLGVGPSLFNLQSRNYNSIGYAEVEGVTVDVTGLVNYSSPSIWAWGGAAQVGMSYFINPTWFIDASYTYAITGSNTTRHQQPFTNGANLAGVNYLTSGTLMTSDTMKISNQSVSVSINKVF